MIASLLLVVGLVWALVGSLDEPRRDEQGEGETRKPNEHLVFIVNYMRKHGLTLEQIAAALARPAVVETPAAGKPKRAAGDIIASVMYFLGAVFVFAGAGIYISTFWNDMSPAMHIIVTLGVGIGLSVLSVIAMKEGKYERAILPMIVMAALIETGGWFVFLHEVFPSGDDYRKAALFCFGMMAFQQGMVFHKFRRNSLCFSAIAFTYGALQFALDIIGMRDEHIALLLGGSLIFTATMIEKTANRRVAGVLFAIGGAWFNTGVFGMVELAISTRVSAMVGGVSIVSFALAMRAQQRHKLAGLSFFIGSACFYAGLFDMVYHTPWELAYFGIAIGMMYISAMLHSRALLATSVLAILGFIGYYTSEHFVNSAGWPIALMFMGIAFLGIGTMALRIKRRYNM